MTAHVDAAYSQYPKLIHPGRSIAVKGARLKQAWVRFLQSSRDEAAAATYMEDQFSGPVG